MCKAGLQICCNKHWKLETKGKRWSHQAQITERLYVIISLISSALFLTNAVAVPIPTLSVSTSWSHLTHLMLTRLMSTRHTWHILLVLRQAGKQHQEFDSLGWGVETLPSPGRLGHSKCIESELQTFQTITDIVPSLSLFHGSLVVHSASSFQLV